MSLLKSRSGGENPDSDGELADEKILNVIRRADELALKTGEVADELPITQKWTGTRLNQLEADGRVHSKSSGNGRVWWLDEDEPTFPVKEGVGDTVWYSVLAGRLSDYLALGMITMFAVSGVFVLVILLTNWGIVPSNQVVTTDVLATSAFLSALLGVLLLIGSSGLRIASWAIPAYLGDSGD
jgi:hypothetical protein